MLPSFRSEYDKTLGNLPVQREPAFALWHAAQAATLRRVRLELAGAASRR